MNFLLKQGQSKSVKTFGSCLAGWCIEEFFFFFFFTGFLVNLVY